MKNLAFFRWLVAVCAALSVTCGVSRAWAYPGNQAFTNAENPSGSPGYVTSSLWAAAAPHPAQTFSGCQSCHGQNGPTPTALTLAVNGGSAVSLTGTPNFNVVAGQTSTFTLSWTSVKGAGGFLVMHDDTSDPIGNDVNGRLHRVSGDSTVQDCKGAPSGTAPNRCNGTFNNNTEVMQRSVKAASASKVTFQFQYDAPANVCKTFEFGLWVNDVNNDLTCFNGSDHPQFRAFTITTTCADDGNDCTVNQCSGGACSYPAGNAGTVCRAAAGECDQQETCNGSSTSCPANSFKSGVVCRASAGSCDPAEQCSGSSATCPGDTLLGSGTTCRASAGTCDVAETCDGANPGCPTNGFKSGGSCRASAGPCDVVETCPGNSADCPSDGFAGSGTSCRAASCTADVATLPANCTGSSASCPGLQTVNCAPFTCSGNICSGGCATDANCQAGNYCSGGLCKPKIGNGVACGSDHECSTGMCVDGVCCTSTCGGGDPSDCQACNVSGSLGQCVARPSGQTCRTSTGACDPAETCNGTSTSCPADALSTSGTVCRAANGLCDKAESCDGTTAACPADTFAAAGVVCRASAGPCDIQEICSGSSTACPGDAFSSSSVVCRTAAGPCDLPESCTGSSAACPSNALRGAGVQCGAPSCISGTATPAQNCTGSAASCPTPTTVECDPYVCGATACLGDCVTDIQCVPDSYCSAGKCVPKLPVGKACGADGQCEGGRCVDGFCCNSDCTGQCEACNVAGSEGTCSPATGDPVGQRPTCSSDGSVCGGSCDGSLRRACTYPGSGTGCRAASCTGGVATLAAVCNARGACPPAFEQQCPGSSCSGTQCEDECVLDIDCALGQFCSAGVCVAQQPRGKPCPSDAACTSGTCVDGICCNSPCTGQCEACDVAGKEGTCSPVAGKPHGARTACTTDGSVCAGSCDGTDRTGCAYPDGTSCRAGSCSGGIATLAAACSGDGRCPAVQGQICPAACSGALCGGAGACTMNAQCDATEWCSGGVCVPTLGVGAACSADAQCTLGFCVDGFCCSQACTGQCEACDLPGKEGFCDTVPEGLPHGGRDACPGSGPCGGECRGEKNACGFPTSERACGSPSCVAGVQTDAASCNGAGSCVGSTPRSCGSYACGEDACLDTCGSDQECSPGASCEMGECIVPPDPTTGEGGEGGTGNVNTAGEGNQPTGGRDPGTSGKSGMPTDGGMGSEPTPSEGGAPPDGMTPEGGADSSTPGTKNDSGCGCRTAGSGDSKGAVALLLLLLGVSVRRRAQSRSRAERLRSARA